MHSMGIYPGTQNGKLDAREMRHSSDVIGIQQITILSVLTCNNNQMHSSLLPVVQ